MVPTCIRLWSREKLALKVEFIILRVLISLNRILRRRTYAFLKVIQLYGGVCGLVATNIGKQSIYNINSYLDGVVGGLVATDIIK